MDIFQAVILGVVQGVSEFLPISSTGHLILAERFLNMASSEFLKSFNIIIQLGSILAVVFLYWRKLFTQQEITKRVFIAFLPTGILGVIFYKIVRAYFLDNEKIVLWSLLLGGIALIVFEFWHCEKESARREISAISYKNALLIGLFQSAAMAPGISRSAATIIGGLFLGLNRKTIVEFSFMLAAPTMLAATGWDLFKNWGQFSVGQWHFLVAGFIVSFLAATASIKFLLNFIKRYSFAPFGVYRIILAMVFWLIMF